MIVGRDILTNFVGNDTVENICGSNQIPKIFYKEIGSCIGDSIYKKKSKSG